MTPEITTEEGAMMTALCAALDEKEFSYLKCDTISVVLFFRERSAKYAVFLQVTEEPRVLNVWTTFHAIVPPDARADVAALLERINPRITGGRMELDDKGELYMRIRAEMNEAALTAEFVRSMMRGVVLVSEDYHGLLMRVAFGGMTLEQAIVEGELW